MNMIELITKKRDGLKLDYDDFNFISKGAADGSIPDYQLTSWLMASFLNGMDDKETSYLTRAMALSGKRLDLRNIKKMKVDKHSTGGVGDGISLALAPIVASCGVCVPMMSGRGLGHTGGTLDKLESIRNFEVRLGYSNILRQLKAIDVCMFGQTSELAPADKKLYALRDASATVESIPLIVSSILSKKYAEGINALVIDVKFGSGAFMKDYRKAKELAVALVKTAKLLGISSVAVMSNMNLPLGRAVGNGIEMEQAIRILNGENISDDFEDLLYLLSGYMICLGKKAKSIDEAMDKARDAVRTKKALNKLREIIKWQKGDLRVCENPSVFIKKSRLVSYAKATADGYISDMDARTVGLSTIALGVGRTKAEDSVDYGAGIWLSKKYGDLVKKGDIIATVYGSDINRLNECIKIFETSIKISQSRPPKLKLIGDIVR
ncbi:MAG: thymidine phosphorylase [Elusimicrobiales bacterium]|jgi:pyrimidine-nucleoside phosphorylase|nr:thymidine phosphorylase [Elusimicrobiales bacterium]NLH39170.1 thymidine phosphorylase [Elusimicrobiota bacterium]